MAKCKTYLQKVAGNRLKKKKKKSIANILKRYVTFLYFSGKEYLLISVHILYRKKCLGPQPKTRLYFCSINSWVVL